MRRGGSHCVLSSCWETQKGPFEPVLTLCLYSTLPFDGLQLNSAATLEANSGMTNLTVAFGFGIGLLVNCKLG